MTTPTGGGGVVAVTALSPTLAAVDETVRSADRLGLTWKLRPATALLPPVSDPTQTPILIDGDTEPVNAYSLLGALVPGSRVITMHVPPSGIYVTGFVGVGPTDTVVGAIATETVGFILSTSGGAESNIPELALENASISAGHAYSFMGNILVNGGSEADSFLFRWRKGTPVTGAIITTFVYLPESNAFDNSRTFDAIYSPSDSGTDTYYLSVQRAAGGGTLNIYGASRSHARLERVGTYTPGASLFTNRA